VQKYIGAEQASERAADTGRTEQDNAAGPRIDEERQRNASVAWRPTAETGSQSS